MSWSKTSSLPACCKVSNTAGFPVLGVAASKVPFMGQKFKKPSGKKVDRRQGLFSPASQYRGAMHYPKDSTWEDDEALHSLPQ